MLLDSAVMMELTAAMFRAVVGAVAVGTAVTAAAAATAAQRAVACGVMAVSCVVIVLSWVVCEVTRLLSVPLSVLIELIWLSMLERAAAALWTAARPAKPAPTPMERPSAI